MKTARALSGSTTNDYAPANLGQLKNVASLFYNRLIQVGYTSQYPWVSSTNAANDYAVANIGQMKNMFSFDVTYDSRGDGVPDWWEEDHFGSNPAAWLSGTAVAPAGNGLTISQDYNQGNDPTNYYSQNGGIITVNLSMVSGNGQSGPAETLLPEPLVVQVTGSTGQPLVNAPVTFTVTQGVGLVTGDSGGGSVASSAQIRSGTNGDVMAYFQQPFDASFTSTIAAQASGTEVDFSEVTILDTEAPIAPSNLSGIIQDDGSVSLTWSDNSDNETGFSIERSDDGGQTWTVVGSVGVNVTSFVGSSSVAGTNGISQFEVVADSPYGNTPNTGGTTTPVKQIPATVYADIDISGSTSGGNPVYIMAFDDQNNATFGYSSGTNTLVVNQWANGVTSAPIIMPTELPGPGIWSSITDSCSAVFLTTSGTVYGNFGSNGYSSDGTPANTNELLPYTLIETYTGDPWNFLNIWGGSQSGYYGASSVIPFGPDGTWTHFITYNGTTTYFLGDSPVDLSYWEADYPLASIPETYDYNPATMTGTDQPVPADTSSMYAFFDFYPVAMNNVGQTIGLQSAYDPTTATVISTDAVISGNVCQALPSTSQVAAINNQGQVIGGYGADAYLWNGTATYLNNLVSETYPNQIQNICPYLISDADSNGTINIFLTANQLDPAGSGQLMGTQNFRLTVNGATSSLTTANFPTGNLISAVAGLGGVVAGIANASEEVDDSSLGDEFVDMGMDDADSSPSPQVVETASALVPMDVVADSNNNYQVDPTDQVLNYVRFGLWDHAFDSAIPAHVLNGNAETANFVGSDSRRFYFRVSDPSAKGSGTVTADWFTQKSNGTNDDHPATDTVTLTETPSGSGIFVSKALMLVTDEVDNAQPTNTGLPGGGNAAEGVIDHRLRRAALGDNMCFGYTPAAAGSPKTIKTLSIFNPVGGSDGIKAMTVQIASLFGGKSFTPILSDSYIQAIEASVKVRFAVAGIQVNFHYNDATDRIAVNSSSIDLNAVEEGSGYASGNEGQLATLVKNRYPGADPHTIFLILIQQFGGIPLAGGGILQLQGQAFTDGYIARYPSLAPSLHCSFVAKLGSLATSSTTCVPPHELGHQLGCQTSADEDNGNHYTAAQLNENLMKMQAGDIAPGLPNGSRRLWDDPSHPYMNHQYQIDYMRQSPLLQSTQPPP